MTAMETVLSVIENESGEKASGATLLEDLEMDSLEFASMILALNEASGKDLPVEKAAGCRTIEELAALIA